MRKPFHYIAAEIGFGNNNGLADLRKALNWWQGRPAFAATRRGQERIAILTRDIARLEQTQTQPAA